MVRKKLATVVAALGAMQAGWVSALGIGELTLQSALNQPLVAEINLLNVEDLDNTQIIVKLADPKDFQNAGVSRDFFLTNIRFNVELDGNGGGMIKLSTRDAVVEPYLNFLVETRWPSGRLLREFTVLLDLPVFSESQAKPVETASSGPERQPAPIVSSGQPSTVARTQVAQPTAGADRFGGDLSPGGEYRVRNDDTLWDIAVAARPSSRYSVQQTMLGIQRLNPDAFANGNINRLKAGFILRLPTEDEIADTSISRQDAVSEVASQNRAWRTGSDGSLASDGAQLDATDASIDDSGSFEAQDRLSIAAAGSSQSDNVGDGEGVGGSGSTALKNQLAMNQEMLDKSRLEKEELQSRLDDVEAKLATVQRLLELKSDQLTALQRAQGLIDGNEATPGQQLAGTQLPVDEDPVELDPGLPGNPTAAQNQIAIESKRQQLARQDGQEITPQDIDQALNQPGRQQPESAATPPSPVPEKGLLDRVLTNPMYLVGAGALILGALAVAAYIRRRREEEEEYEFEEEQSNALADVSFDDNDFLDTNATAGTEGQTFEAEDSLTQEDDLTAVGDETASDDDEMTTFAEQQSVVMQPETEDAISEADIYVAYGRYQQAVDLLRSAIGQEPERTDLQLKLLEVYVETRDKPSFQQQYMQLETLGDANAVAQVKEMLSTVDGVSDWLDDLPGSEGVTAFTDEDMDADLIEGDVDIELDLDDTGITDIATEVADAPATDAQATDFDSIDLELDLDDSIADVDANTELGEISLELDDSTELGEFNLELDNDNTSLADADDDATAVELDDMDLDDLDADTEIALEADDFDLDLDHTDGTFDLDLADLTENSDLSELEAEFGEEQPTAVSSAMDELDLATELGLPEEDDDSVPDIDLSVVKDLDLELEDLGEGTAEDNQVTAVADAVVEESFAQPLVERDTGNDSEFDFLSDTDEVATKLDLARAYIDMGDNEGAKDILDEVLQEGSDEQKQEADSLIERIE